MLLDTTSILFEKERKKERLTCYCFRTRLKIKYLSGEQVFGMGCCYGKIRVTNEWKRSLCFYFWRVIFGLLDVCILRIQKINRNNCEPHIS